MDLGSNKRIELMKTITADEMMKTDELKVVEDDDLLLATTINYGLAMRQFTGMARVKLFSTSSRFEIIFFKLQVPISASVTFS